MNQLSTQKLTSVFVGALLLLGVFIHTEVLIAARSAPENILVQVYKNAGVLEGQADCYADILTEHALYNTKKKPLRRLESLYDFLDSANFFVSSVRGFQVLETGLRNYRGDYEIRIVCYAEDLNGVSYTIINNENQADCDIREKGRTLICG